MQENDILKNNEEVIDSTITLVEDDGKVETIETIEIIEVDDDNSYVIDTFNAFPAMGESNENLRHTLLNDRSLPDQHPIMAITGLREELDDIQSLKAVYSNEKGVADYYEWEDGNAFAEDRFGYFVTLCENVRAIKICQGTDVFGVVLDSAAFIGGQDDAVRDYKYGLVAHSGVVHVRCELDVEVDNYITANAYGMARKTDHNCGCKVIAIHDINGVRCATISLDVPVNQVYDIGREIDNLAVRVGANEVNIVSAINVANKAHQLALETNELTEEQINDIANKVKDAVDKADAAVDTTESLGTVVTQSQTIAVQAKAIAESAATSAEAMRNEAITNATETWGKIKELTDDIEVVDGKTETAMSAIVRNGKELQSLMTVIDKYSVGEYSQANGLTLEQAHSILERGMIYVPTKHAETEYHTETYQYIDTNNATQTYTREFTPGYLYQWDDIDNGDIQMGWLTIGNSPSVYFSITEPHVNDRLAYWYTDGDEIVDINGEVGVYEPYTLYKWEEDHWLAVATLKGNVTNRAVSQIRQDAKSIELSVTALDDKYAGTKIWVDDNKTAIQDTVAWQSDNAESITTFMQEAGDNFASAAQVAKIVDKDGNIQAASIVTAVNESESSVCINADKIVMTGTTTFLTPSDVGETGSTTIHGARIQTGSISADRIDVKDLKAFNATIGGFTINDKSISNNKQSCEANDPNNGVYLGTDGISLGANGAFYVTPDGSLHSQLGTIGGWSIGEQELYGETGSVLNSFPVVSEESSLGTASWFDGKYLNICTAGSDDDGEYKWYEIPQGCKKLILSYHCSSADQQYHNNAGYLLATGMSVSGDYITFTFNGDAAFTQINNQVFEIDITEDIRYLVMGFEHPVDADYHYIEINCLCPALLKAGLYIGSDKTMPSILSDADIPLRFYVESEGENTKSNAFAVLADGTTYVSALNAVGILRTGDAYAQPLAPASYINGLGVNIMISAPRNLGWVQQEINTLPDDCDPRDWLYVGWNLSILDSKNPKLVAVPTLYNKTNNSWYRSKQHVVLASIDNPENLWGYNDESVSPSESESGGGGPWRPTDKMNQIK